MRQLWCPRQRLWGHVTNGGQQEEGLWGEGRGSLRGRVEHGVVVEFRGRDTRRGGAVGCGLGGGVLRLRGTLGCHGDSWSWTTNDGVSVCVVLVKEG